MQDQGYIVLYNPISHEGHLDSWHLLCADLLLRAGWGIVLAPVLEAAFKEANALYAELSAKNANWRKIYASYAKFRDDAILWARFSDGSFDSFMAAMKR